MSGCDLTSVGLEELADEPERLAQDLGGCQRALVVQQEVPDGLAGGAAQVQAVEDASVQLCHVEPKRNLELQHHVELICAVDLREEWVRGIFLSFLFFTNTTKIK